MIENRSSSSTSLSIVRSDTERRRGPQPSALEELLGIEPSAQACRHHASLDPATGLLSRAAFLDAVQAALDAGEAVAMLVCEIRGLARINALCGQRAGDRVIADAAGLVRRSVRATDVCARAGGNELAVLLRGVRAPAGHAVAERVRGAVAAVRVPSAPHGIALFATVTIGVATAPPGERAEGLLSRARQAGATSALPAARPAEPGLLASGGLFR
jgi:diguanylate cyclase (GGDEF)-like protein